MTAMMNTRKKLTAMVIAALVMTAMLSITAHAAAPKNPYIGGWTTKVENVTANIDVFDNGTVCVVFSDDPSTGTYYNYVIAEDGSLVVFTDESEMIGAYGMYNPNMLLDYDGRAWTRTY